MLNAYLEAEASTGNLIGLAALPLFLPCGQQSGRRSRCCARAWRRRDQAEAARDEARAYFALAREFLAPTRAAPRRHRRIVRHGQVRRGARDRASSRRFPGSGHVRSDVERKRLFGVAQTEAAAGIALMRRRSPTRSMPCAASARAMALDGGQAVIVDAVHAKPEEREAWPRLRPSRRRPSPGFGSKRRTRRHAGRGWRRGKGDVSDATPAVVDEQLGYDLGRKASPSSMRAAPLDGGRSGSARRSAHPGAGSPDSSFANPLWPRVGASAGSDRSRAPCRALPAHFASPCGGPDVGVVVVSSGSRVRRAG